MMLKDRISESGLLFIVSHSLYYHQCEPPCSMSFLEEEVVVLARGWQSWVRRVLLSEERGLVGRDMQ